MSEYIPRLREQLVAAAAREQAGQRHRPLVTARTLALGAAAAAIAVALVLAVRTVDIPTDETPAGVEPGALVYRSPDAARCADVLRARIAAMGIGATVSVSGDRVTVDASPADRAAIAALAVPGRLAVYDWEASVLGRDGRPAPVGDDPGRSGAVSRGEAARRAGMVSGAAVVRAFGGDGWFALAGERALDNADVAGAMSLREPGTGASIVAIELTGHGQAQFEALTRALARRGADSHRPGSDAMRELQHLAIVLDDEILAVPFVDFRQAPDGLDGAGGMQIMGDFPLERAQQIAAILRSGPLPAPLTPS